MADLTADVAALFSEVVERCPCCDETSAVPFETRTFNGVPVRYVRCRMCGLVYQSPRIPEDALPHFYAALYRRFYVGQAAPTARQLAIEQARAGHLLAVLPADFRPRLHLDIGCGSGTLLQASRERYGCRVAGIEPDDEQRAYASARGLDVYAALDQWRAATGERADLISLSHVLEHLNDPVGQLQRLATDALAPGGLLLIEAPNVYWHWALEVAHPLAFAPSTLRATLDRAGFEVTRLVRHGIPASRLPLYLSAVARQRSGASSRRPGPDRFPRLRRRIGITLLGIERFGPTILRRLRARIARVRH